MKRGKYEKEKVKVIDMYLVLIIIAVLALGIAYAQIVDEELTVTGNVESEVQDGVFITQVTYKSNEGADTANSVINYYLGTMMDSKITLGSSSTSTISYDVTVYNNTDKEQLFIKTLTDDTDEILYSNTNIGYSVSIEDYVTTIAPKQSLTFTITFAYNGTNTSNRVLNSKLNFRFREKPVISLSNEGTTYELENIYAGYTPAEYEFTVKNNNTTYTNGVPMTYTFQTTLTEGSPLTAEIYDASGNKVTGAVTLTSDGTKVENKYKLKLTWDSSKTGTEYQGKEYSCKVVLKADPTEAKYLDYIIEKEFNVKITTNTPPTVSVEVSNVGATEATIKATGSDSDGDTIQYTLEINGQTYGPDTTNEWIVTGLTANETYTYTVTVTDGKETTTSTGELTTVCLHSYENGICTICGKICEHDYGDWQTITAATCGTEGSKKRTCNICENIETQTIAATGIHTYATPAGSGTKFTTTGDYTDGTNTAKIPAGFTVSGVGGTCTGCGVSSSTIENVIDEGLVIYLIDDMTTTQIANIQWNDETTLLNLKKTYDQFVWIPIPQENINDMYMCQKETGKKSCKIGLNSSGEAYCSTHSSTAMAGRLYATSTGENFNASLITQTYNANEREPDILSSPDGNSTYLAQLNEILSTTYASSSDFKTDLQSEYNEIVKSVYKNEGFYIGRYETSGMKDSNTNVTIKVVAGSDGSTNALSFAVLWYRMYAQQKKYAENKGLDSSMGSTMIQGAAYDQVMKFVHTDTYDVTTYGNVGHGNSYFTTKPYQTGGLNYSTVYTGTVEYNDVSKNIYDLEGNVFAWTTEVSSLNGRVGRGGTFFQSFSSSNRSSCDPRGGGMAYMYYGSICQLYVK